MADVKGAVIGDGTAFSGDRFAGRPGSFIPGGEGSPELTRYYTLRGWNAVLGQWETWASRSPNGQDNPSGDDLAHVTYAPWERIAYFNED